jgi:hypothetical protein
MRKTLLLALLAVYTFHIKVTDGRTALLANPRFDELKLSPEQLDRAAYDRVMLLDHASGAHWIWLMMSWPEDRPVVEQTLNDGAPGKPDIGLTPKSETEVTIRCLQEQCRIGKVTLKNGQSTDVPFDSDVSVTIQSSTH